MAWAVCTTCGKRTAWTATRGARQADRTCPCGGRLEAATGNVGKRLATCPVCRRRRYHPSVGTRQLERAARVWIPCAKELGDMRPPATEHPAGTIVCSAHHVEPIDLQGGMDGQPVWVSPHPHVAEAMAVPGLGAEQTYRAQLRRRGDDLVAVVPVPPVTLTLRECAWRPVPREEVPTA